jgi:hypothetical protein
MLLLLLLALAAPARAQDGAYTDALRDALAAVEDAEAAPDAAARAGAVGRARRALERARAATGEQPPYLAHVEDALGASPPDLTRARGYLEDLLNALGQPPAGQAAGAEEELRGILRDPRFAPEPPPNWFEERVGRFLEWLADLFPDAAPGPAPSRAALSIEEWVLVLACAVLVAGAGALVYRGWRDRRREAAEADSGGDADLSPGSVLATAAEYARRGDYRAAVRARFVALLLHLHEQGRLRYDRSLTNREHLARIGLGTPLAEDLRPVVRTFDDVWYGNTPISPDEYALFERRADGLRAGTA